jgi:hypothetical protein
MIPTAERILVATAFSLIATAALAQNADFDQSFSSGFQNLAYGVGAKTILTVVFAWLAISGLAHDPPRVSRVVAGLAGVVLYWGSAAILGRMGIV